MDEEARGVGALLGGDEGSVPVAEGAKVILITPVSPLIGRKLLL